MDLAQFQSDGSPHYIPPTEDLLKGIINVLHEWSIHVLGIANAPMVTYSATTTRYHNEQDPPPTKDLNGATPKNVEEIVSSLGLPSVMSIRPRGPQDNVNYTLKMEDIIQLIQAKENEDIKENEQEFVNNTNPKVSSIHHNNDPQIRLKDKRNDMDINTDTTYTRESNEADSSLSSTFESSSSSSSLNPEVSSPPLESPSTIPTTAKIHHGSVRSGQQISAENNRSLIVLGSVHSGGEVMADGDIYVYGKLRGRALAGLGLMNGGTNGMEDGDNQTHNDVNENQNAVIVASQFDPELICIGGIYTTIDNVQDFGLKERGCPAMVSVDFEKGMLVFEEIAL